MVGTVALAIGTAALGTILLGPSSASSQTETGEAELRAYWQGRYRSLRKKEATLVETVKLATKEYADSNRRTYRRSGVRHFHRTNANEAKAELSQVRAEMAAMYDEASAAGVPIFWLDEVAEETIDPGAVEGLGVYEDDGQFGGKGAYAKDSAEEDSDADAAGEDDGRNPLYTGNGDEPASLEGDGSKKLDYEAWRANREAYERERAPEKHLAPDWQAPAEED
jgi:hypothetical protein